MLYKIILKGLGNSYLCSLSANYSGRQQSRHINNRFPDSSSFRQKDNMAEKE